MFEAFVYFRQKTTEVEEEIAHEYHDAPDTGELVLIETPVVQEYQQEVIADELVLIESPVRERIIVQSNSSYI